MARRRGPILIVISLVLAVLAAWVANAWLAMRANAKIGPTPEPVVTAAVDMPLGTRLKDEQLVVINVPPGTAPKGSFQRTSDLVGKVTATAVVAGEILLETRLANSGKGSALASIVDKNMRAVTVRVDDMVGVSGFLAPGNRVDVIATKQDAGTSQVKATTILSNIKVIAVDQSTPMDPSQPSVVHAVTLMVTPADAELLFRGRASGMIQLTLRNPLDQSDTRTREPVVPVKVVEAPKPKIVKSTEPQVTIIRGTDIGSASPSHKTASN
jgi:pilus assembly protein CpaB